MANKVLNAKVVGKPRPSDPYRVYVGRPSKWGNPFVIPRHGSRAEVIAKYREWIVRQPKLMADLPELRGKDLVCHCAPEPCHGDVLLELANPKPRRNRKDYMREFMRRKRAAEKE
jgi:hypothetical protein